MCEHPVLANICLLSFHSSASTCLGRRCSLDPSTLTTAATQCPCSRETSRLWSTVAKVRL
ncbi:hypothetical protein E2C01_100459 [Portunus trituberculatus]|uniref:Uncharacterized protein n=1 Tax=Portunus trituberculatus TaxID=210409 RepID=A0A5B7K838_PORTR|nr:hypothetical protein [Portunus trituberculatus]